MRVYGFHYEAPPQSGVKSSATYTRMPARSSAMYQEVARNTVRTPAPSTTNATHRVAAGENLTRIVREFLQKSGQAPTNSAIYDGVRKVAAHNGLRNADLIHPGQELDLTPLRARSGATDNLPLTPKPLAALTSPPARKTLAVKTPVDSLRSAGLTTGTEPVRIQVTTLAPPQTPDKSADVEKTVEAPSSTPPGVDGSTNAAMALQRVLNGTADALTTLRNLMGEEAATTTAPASPWESVLKGGARLSSDYGMRKDPFTGRLVFHDGIDLAAKRGTEITALRAGQVIYSGRKGGYGNTVVVRHSDGYESVYGHTAKNHVSVGDTVQAGTVIAEVGSTGRSTGPHLHLEMRRHGKSVNPLSHLEESPLRLARNGGTGS